MSRKVLLVDGNSLTYRAFFALPPDMATASGQVTNAVFGFTSMLIYVLKDQQPDGVIVAFDRPEPTFRHAAEPQYKAQRTAAPDILRQQMGLVREVLSALGIQQVELAGWEADDLIATISTKLVERGDELKLVHPHPGAEPERFEHLAFAHFFLQPMHGPDRERNTALAVEHCLRHPRWRLSLQTHKLIGIP